MVTQRKAFVLLSGGLDSTTCLYKAVHDYAPRDIPIYGDRGIAADVITRLQLEGPSDTLSVDWVEAFSVDYGQRHKKEMEYAKRSCDQLGIKHTILDVGALLSGRSVMLSAESVGHVTVPDISYGDIKGVSPTYVPFRNGLLLSAITAQAQKWVNDQVDNLVGELERHNSDVLSEGELRNHATHSMRDSAGVYFGAHSEDAQNWAYPDCTPEFIGAMANAIHVGSYYAIRLHTPLQWLMKDEIVKLGNSLNVPFANTWSCYKGEEQHCGICPTCRSRREAFFKAGILDPTSYAHDGVA
jgi:7-cyano-7-deazaguanine synthase